MSRVATSLIVSLFASTALGPALAADWPMGNEPSFRPAYPVDTYPIDDSLDFEAGLRYFYGMGGQSFGSSSGSARDTSHALEVHGRINDHSTSTYLKGHIGYGSITDGEYRPVGTSYNIGRVGYINADFGYLPLATDSFSAGAFLGYMYSDESPENVGLITHGLRLGIAAKAGINDVFDINAEAAIIPYTNTTGSMTYNGATISDVSGGLYGASGEVLAGFHVSDNFIVRAGVRATYLNGHVSSDHGEQYVEMFRWGPLVELTASF